MLQLAILIVGVIGMGLADVTFVDALISERHSAGIGLIILIRKNLCSKFVSEEKSHEKELFAEIKSLIFTKPKFTIFLLYIDYFVITKKFVISDNFEFVNDFFVTTWSFSHLPLTTHQSIPYNVLVG